MGISSRSYVTSTATSRCELRLAGYSDSYPFDVPYAALAKAGAAVFGKSSTTLFAFVVRNLFNPEVSVRSMLRLSSHSLSNLFRARVFKERPDSIVGFPCFVKH